jgi:GDPmannose 4,6-dehydratase
MKLAIITGINGQDGSYLAELLLEKKYIVMGLIRRSSNINTQRIEHLLKDKENLILRYFDSTDSGIFNVILSNIENIYNNIEVLEIYNMAAMSHVKVSFDLPEYTANVDGLGVLRILEAIKESKLKNIIKFYQASTSELYGKVQEIPQTEKTPFYPRSPYGVAKLYGYWITKNYREAYNIFASNGILFNHESPRRGYNFVTRKISLGLSKILSGEEDKLIMGNIDSIRDWGHTKDYVEGMWRILQADTPEDFVLSSNEKHSVREFIEKAFLLKGFNIKWKGSGVNEIGYDEKTNRELIFISEKYYRPAEVDILIGDSMKARTELGWEPKISFDELIKEMVESDCKN